jgi:ATP synthase protein I
MLAVCPVFLTGQGADNMLRAACRGRLTSPRFRQTAFSGSFFVARLTSRAYSDRSSQPQSGGKDPMAERDGGEEDDRLLRARLETLSGALQKKRQASPTRSGADDGGGSGNFSSGMGLGLRAASELVAGIVVGGLIGWQLDAWLGTKPAFLIVFFLLGVVAGVWNVVRAASPSSPGAAAKRGPKTPAAQDAPSAADEDED